MVTVLPIVGWGGRGPGISFALYHNMTSPWSRTECSFGEPIPKGDANGDGMVTESDIDPFIDIMLDPTPTEEDLLKTDFDENAEVDTTDMGGLLETLSLQANGPDWRHSYSSSLFRVVGDLVGNCGGGLTVGEQAILTRDDGTQDIFTFDGTRFVSPPGALGLVRFAHGSGGTCVT